MFERCLSGKRLAGKAGEKEVIVCFTIPDCRPIPSSEWADMGKYLPVRWKVYMKK